MKLSRIFEHLTHVAISKLVVGGAKEGMVNLKDYPQLITLTNAGLLNLYTRFPLRMREIPLQLQDGQTLYQLHSDYAESNTGSTELVKYIVDGEMIYPFTDNIIVIDQVFDEAGIEVPLNDITLDNSVFTPSSTELQVPDADAANMLAVLYRATPDIIDPATLDTDLVEVDLPYHFMEAITSFIAWKLYSPIDKVETPLGQIHKANYYEAIQLIEQKGAVISDAFVNQRFEVNGWL